MTTTLLAMLVLLAGSAEAQTCVIKPPTIDQWQTIQGGPIGYAAGTDEQVNVLISNNDIGCEATTYLVTAEPYNPALMQGWAFYVKPDGGTPPVVGGQLSVNAIHIVSPATAAPGTYTVKVTIAPQNAPQNTVVAYLGAVVIPTGTVCTLSPPVVTVLPPIMTDVVPGSLLSFTVGILNRNSVACVMTAFSLDLSSTPVSLPSVFLGSNTTVSVGATGSVSLQVALPADASGSYSFKVQAKQVDAPLNVGEATATATVKALLPLALSLSTDKASYKRGVSAKLQAAVLGPAPVPGVVVTFTVTDPTQLSHPSQTALTDTDGRASVAFPLAKTAARGTYTVKAYAVKPGSIRADGTAVFTAQ